MHSQVNTSECGKGREGHQDPADLLFSPVYSRGPKVRYRACQDTNNISAHVNVQLTGCARISPNPDNNSCFLTATALRSDQPSTTSVLHSSGLGTLKRLL